MKVNSVCIVGGGSSGWMMAIALQKNLPSLEVTLVESPNTPTIGVGEATIPYTSYFISQILGFEEKEWMSYCDASYKAAIRFCEPICQIYPFPLLATLLPQNLSFLGELSNFVLCHSHMSFKISALENGYTHIYIN